MKTNKDYETLQTVLKHILVTLLFVFIFGAGVCLGLTPLGMGIANGHSIHGGINDTPLSFGLAFIGTFFAIGGIKVGFN